MSNLDEIKLRLENLTKLSNDMKEHFTKLKGPEGEELKKRAKKGGIQVGVGAGIGVFGLSVLIGASLYILAVIILCVNVALNRPWLSALIVVGGFLLIGIIIMAAGIGVAKPGAKELSKASEEKMAAFKATSAEMKAETEALQAALKQESEARQKQMKDMMEQAKAVAPTAAPVALGGLLVMHLMKRHHRRKKENKRILRVIEMYESSKAAEEAE